VPMMMIDMMLNQRFQKSSLDLIGQLRKMLFMSLFYLQKPEILKWR